MVPGKAIDADAVRSVLHGHQFNGRLGKLLGGGVGPVYVPLKKAGNRQGAGLGTGSGQTSNGSREARRGLSNGGVGKGHSRNAIQCARGIAPCLGWESGDEGGTITGAVQSVVPLFDEEGELTRFPFGGAEMEQAGDVVPSRDSVLDKEEVPWRVLAEKGERRKGQAIARTAKMDVGVAEDTGALGARA